MKLDLTAFFQREARTIISRYKSLITQKRGVAMDDAPHNKPSTVKRKRKDHWMVDTGELNRSGFDFRVRPTELLIFASGKRHSGKRSYMTKAGKRISYSNSHPTYRQLFKWHNQKGYSGVFGKLPTGSQFPKRLVTEIVAQLRPQMVTQLSRKIRIQVGK
ncbi:MAG: hypothetical protein PHV11_06275 [Candidatus Bipolaricaulis sp.]|nr:hypothetical protein [Candidatus Bipolaricaulis sp.]